MRMIRATCVALAALVVAGVPTAARAHPLHTTLTELSYDARSGAVSISLRLFADDFAAAVTRTSTGGPRGATAMPPDTAMFRYISQRFSLVAAGAAGRPVALRWCGVRRTGEVVFVCLQGTSGAPLSGARLMNRLMTETFDDQVNMVQALHGGRRQMLLFTKRDGPKALA